MDGFMRRQQFFLPVLDLLHLEAVHPCLGGHHLQLVTLSLDPRVDGKLLPLGGSGIGLFFQGFDFP